MTTRGAEATARRGSWMPVRDSRGSVAVGFILGLLFASAVIFSTSGGLSIGQGDPPSYLSSAESLSADLGYRTPYGDPNKPIDFDEATSPVVDWPPGYPAILSLGVTAGLDSESAARLVSALAVFVITVVVYVVARSVRLPQSGAALAAAIAATLTLPYTGTALSEPLYGLILILALTAMAAYVRTRGALALILATLLATAATAVRTTGIALLATLVLLTWLSLRAWQRWIIPLAVLGFGLSPFYLSTGFGTKVLQWHPPDLASVKIFANAVAGWFVPPVGTPTLRILVFLALAVGLLLWLRPWRNRRKDEPDRESFSSTWSVGLIAAFAQMAVLVATKFFLSFHFNFGARQLYPIALALLVALVHYSGNGRRDRRLDIALVVVGLSCVLATGWAAANSLSAVAAGQRGFNSVEFLRSDAVEFVVGSGPGDMVYSNVPDGLWVAGLPHARPVPTLYDPLSLSDNELRDDEMSRLVDEVEDGALIFYYFDHDREYLVSQRDLASIAPCVVITDGTGIVLSATDHPGCLDG